MDFSIFFYLNVLGGNTKRGNLRVRLCPRTRGEKAAGVCVWTLLIQDV